MYQKMRKYFYFTFTQIILICLVSLSFAQEFSGTQSTWQGFARENFVFKDLSAIVVSPKQVAPNKPWIFRPAFFGAFAQADAGLLARGWHVVYLDLTHRYGSPKAIALFDSFYEELVKHHQFSPKVTLEGISRGGLFVVNWAKQNPDKVAAIYLDAPVCDVKSWPSKKQAELWQGFINEYQLNDKEADNFKGNAIDNLETIAKAGIPILSVCGDADKVVPYAENSAILRRNLMKLGGNMRTILKPGVDHHPHALPDSTPIVNFVHQHTADYQSKMHYQLRGNLNNARNIFEKTKKGRVAFLGGSITEGNGWRNAICEELKQRFPDTEFDFIAAGISSMGSTPHAFRFKNDVLKNGKVDLLFVEAAVNDFTNFFSGREQIRGMEGMVRQALLSNPDMDIIMLHFIHDPFIEIYKEGKTPEVILNHEKVADYYQITSINLAQEIAERMAANEFTWKDFGGTHPSPLGHTYYSATISAVFDKLWSAKYFTDESIRPHQIKAKPMDKYSYFDGQLIDVRNAVVKNGWHYEKPWKAQTQGEVRKRFSDISILEALDEGAELNLDFEGKAIGIFTLAGPDAGILEFSIDGKPFKKLDLFTNWSSGLYLPWVYVFEAELENKKHNLILRTSKESNPKSVGHACQIYYFVVNGKAN